MKDNCMTNSITSGGESHAKNPVVNMVVGMVADKATEWGAHPNQLREEMTAPNNRNSARAFVQRIENLPQELLTQARWFPVREDKKPKIGEWQKPENQRLPQDVRGVKGFDTSGRGQAVDYLFLDFDHVLTDTGNFINAEAEMVFDEIRNEFTRENFFCERSISGHGLHVLLRPTEGKFEPVNAGKKGTLHLGNDNAKLEVFYGGKARYMLATGNLFCCDKGATIAQGETVDKVFRRLLRDVQKEIDATTPPPKSQQGGPPRRDDEHNLREDTDEYKAFRIQRMLDTIIPAALEDTEWCKVNSACKNEGVPYSTVDAFNRRDTTTNEKGEPRYNETENLRRWDSFTNPNYDIHVLHTIAQRFGYDEKSVWHEYHDTTPARARGVTAQSADHANEVLDNTETPARRDDIVAELFAGNATDRTFARRLEKFCGDSVRWLEDDKSWLIYRRNEFGGGKWNDGGEENSAVLPLAGELADVMTDKAETKAEIELAEKFQSTRKQLLSITQLKSLSSILITVADLNNHAELVNCLDCVIDLQTGAVMQAAPELYMTQSINATFKREVSKENLDFVQNFFAQIQPDEMTRRGLIRWLAYCLTGETCAEKFMVWIGESGANGKGTLSNTILNLFGDYGVGLMPTALLKTNRPADPDKATNALNELFGKRFAISEEVPQSGVLDSSLVKNLTGGDKINLRRNYKAVMTLTNTAKINISGNVTPRVENARDGGILRRLLTMPFNEQFGTTEKPADANLKKKMILPENLAALFAILVADAKEFYEHGLIISDAMTQATKQNLRDSDFVKDFVADNYVIDATATVLAREFIDGLKAVYSTECKPFKRADLIKLITASIEGVTCEVNTHLKQKVFKGIRKPTPQELAAAEKARQEYRYKSADDLENPPFDCHREW